MEPCSVCKRQRVGWLGTDNEKVYTSARPGPLVLEIYDVPGHRVRTLIDALQPAGEGAVVWGGLSGRQEVMAPGAYFARIRTGKTAQSQPMLLME